MNIHKKNIIFSKQNIFLIKENNICSFVYSNGDSVDNYQTFLIELIKNGEIEKFNEPLVFKTLNLSDCGLTEIPKNIIVTDFYDLKFNYIINIPDWFKPLGKTDLSHNNLKSL